MPRNVDLGRVQEITKAKGEEWWEFFLLIERLTLPLGGGGTASVSPGRISTGDSQKISSAHTCGSMHGVHHSRAAVGRISVQEVIDFGVLLGLGLAAKLRSIRANRIPVFFVLRCRHLNFIARRMIYLKLPHACSESSLNCDVYGSTACRLVYHNSCYSDEGVDTDTTEEGHS